MLWLGEDGTQRCRRIAHRRRSAESRGMRGLFHFSIVILGGERETSAPRGVCAGCTGCSVISVQRWFDRVTPRSSAGLRNVVHVLSARIFVHATRWSMFLVVSVVELTFGAATFPEPTHCTTHVTFCTEDKCEDDPETMFPLRMAVCSALWDAVVFSGSLLESSLVEKKGITSAVLASLFVVVLCGTTLWQILDRFCCWTCRGT